ncbi:MAG: hypothetical protein GY854_10385 [Deltaproteobacteria bacterium]|nr:hypothetical protein [Deltaproteobacteria bacterium]
MTRKPPRLYYLIAAIVLTIGVAVGQPERARAASPGGFSAAELKKITPILNRYGVIALAETHADGAPKAMTLTVRVNAPRKEVFKVFEKPENFSYISRLFKENKVLEKHDKSKAYSWASRHKWFSFVGTNSISLYPPRRVDVSIVKSSVGAGSFRILFYEDGPDHTILVLNGLLDVKSSEWLIRYLVGVNPTMKMAMNIAIGIVIMKGTKAMAEQAHAGKPLKKHRTRGGRKGPLSPLNKKQLQALTPLLGRGSVILVQSVKKGRLSQATVVQKVKAPGKKFLVAAAMPELYPKMIKAISNITVHERTKEATEFSWTIGFSIFGLNSRNRLTFAPDGVLIEGLDGDLGGALWQWQIQDTGPSECIVAYHGWANMNKTAYILDKSVKAEPYLEHGFIAGSNMVMLAALKRIVEMQ